MIKITSFFLIIIKNTLNQDKNILDHQKTQNNYKNDLLR